jgi:hypothetical protein
MLMAICACAIGASAKADNNDVVESRVLSPRIMTPLRCLRSVELRERLRRRKEQSSNSRYRKGFAHPYLFTVALRGRPCLSNSNRAHLRRLLHVGGWASSISISSAMRPVHEVLTGFLPARGIIHPTNATCRGLPAGLL